MPRRRLGILICCCTLSAALAASQPSGRSESAQPPQAAAQPTYASRVDLVLVDMRVMNGDDPVTDLRPHEVTLLVDGATRPLVSLIYRPAGDRLEIDRERASRASPQPGQGVPLAAVPRVVIVVDRDSIEPAEARQVRQSAARFIEKLPRDYAVAVATLPLGDGLRFDPDRRKVVDALATAFAGTVRRGPGLEGVAGFGCTGAVASEGCGDLALPGLDPKARAMNLSAEQQTRGHAVLQDLRWLFRAVSDGPSDVVLVTGGLPGDEGLGPEIDRTLAVARTGRVRVHVIEVADLTRVALPQGGHDTLPTLERVEAKRPAAYDLPAETGGIEQARAVSGTAFFTRLARELSGSYLLSFAPLPSERDGRPHRIEVHLSRRPGPTVHARTLFVLPAEEKPREAPPAAAPKPSGEAGPRPARRPEPATRVPVATLIARGSAYVEAFEQSLSSLVAEERYVQAVKLWKGDPPTPGDEPELEWKPGKGEQRDRSAYQVLRRRQLLSDVLLVHPPGKIWIGFRDVAEVNGKPVRDRRVRVDRLFLSGSLDAQRQLQHIADESARYNLGSSRNINMPTFPLELLYPGNVPRFTWADTGTERPTSDGSTCTVVSLREVGDPTMVRTNSGRNVPMTGDVCLEVRTGRVWHFRLDFRQRLEHVEGAFEVTFRPTTSAGILVPDRIWEWSLSDDPEWSGRPSYVEGQASYRNIRRFTVTTEEALQ